jgi:hypothetical protein
MILTGENKSTWRGTYPSATFFTTDPTQTKLVLISGLRDERPKQNQLKTEIFSKTTSELCHAVDIHVMISEKKVDMQNPAGSVNVQEPSARQNALSYFLVGQLFKWEFHKHF